LSLLADPPGVDYSAVPESEVKELRLLSKALPVGPGDNNYYAAPYRMGIQLRPEGDKPFSRRFRDSCSMAMFGAVKEGSACSRRVKALGWLFGLHDNYQDMYRDAPSSNEEYIIKNADGSLRKGGVWAGGPCWLICSRKSVELASRPQNIPQVKELFTPTLYFSDTIFAAGLYECFDPNHPTTPADDMHYKQQLCDYLRGQFGLFGSEEGWEKVVDLAEPPNYNSSP
jgi:hypothetical protein